MPTFGDAMPGDVFFLDGNEESINPGIDYVEHTHPDLPVMLDMPSLVLVRRTDTHGLFAIAPLRLRSPIEEILVNNRRLTYGTDFEFLETRRSGLGSFGTNSDVWDYMEDQFNELPDVYKHYLSMSYNARGPIVPIGTPNSVIRTVMPCVWWARIDNQPEATFLGQVSGGSGVSSTERIKMVRRIPSSKTKFEVVRKGV